MERKEQKLSHVSKCMRLAWEAFLYWSSFRLLVKVFYNYHPTPRAGLLNRAICVVFLNRIYLSLLYFGLRVHTNYFTDFYNFF